MKIHFQSIRIKLVLLLLAVGLIPLIVGTTISYVTSSDALFEKAGHELQSEADHVAFAVESAFSRAQSNLLIASSNPAFVLYFKDPKQRSFWRLEQEKLLLNLQNLFPDAQIDCIFLDTAGQEISRVLQKQPVPPGSQPLPSAPRFPGLRSVIFSEGEIYQGLPQLSPSTHVWAIPFVIPIFEQNRRLGLLRLDINLEYFSNRLRGNISPANHAFIMERSGKILAQTIISIGETRDLPDANELDGSPVYRELVQHALAGEKNRTFITTSRGREYLVAYQPTHSGFWSVLVFMPGDSAALAAIPFGRIPLILAGTFVIIVLLALFIGERISDPIKKVVAGTRTLSHGDFSHRISVNLQDELGELGLAFNAMAEHLQRRDEEILRRNRELTSLNMIATTVNQSLDLDESLNAVLSRILDVTGTHAGGIYLLKDKHILHCQVHSGLSKKWSELFHPQKIGEGWVGLVAKSQEPLIWNASDTENALATSMQDGKESTTSPENKFHLPMPDEILRSGFKSYIGIPLRFKHKVNGVICLLGDTLYHFDTKKVEFLSSICNQIGVSIENARLFANLEKAYEELKATHAQLLQSAKLAAVGELAAGVAHELNQPLMVIRGYTQEILENSLENMPATLQKELKSIEAQTTRMMRIINHLRAFARQSSGTFEPVDINEIVESSFTLITQQLKTHNIAITLKLSETLPKVWGDATLLEQVFLNLITNARDAMEDRGGGTLTVATRMAYKEKGHNRPVEPEVEVVFTDTGSGIAQKYLDKVFDPFFTTKEVGKGTGLGLSIGYSIIKDHGGTIRVDSRIGVGTSFILLFPVDRRNSPRRSNKPQETVTRRL